MKLPRPSSKFDQADEANARRLIEEADARNMKIGVVLDKLMFRDTVSGAIVTLTVASGAVVIT